MAYEVFIKYEKFYATKTAISFSAKLSQYITNEIKVYVLSSVETGMEEAEFATLGYCSSKLLRTATRGPREREREGEEEE